MPARVLVVSAEPDTQVQLGNMLHRDGYQVLAARDANDGLQQWAAQRPDLVALDADLPSASAIAVVTRVRQGEAPGFHTPIVLFGAWADTEAKVRALRAGADDYMAKPLHPQELSARVRGLLARFARPPEAPRKPSVGRVHAYYGAKGGVGTTTLAINTAIAMHSEQRRRVALVDANLQFGDHRVFMDLGPDQRSIVDVVSKQGFDADVVQKAMVHHSSGVDLLLAPSAPEESDHVDPDEHHLLRIIELMKPVYDYIVVDLDERLDDNTLDVIGIADRLIVVMTADVSCLKNVRLVLATMKSLGLEDEQLMLVLNRSNAFTGVSAKSVESVLRRPIGQQIGNDYRSAIGALNSGTPFMTKTPDSALGRGVAELARQLDQEPTIGTVPYFEPLELHDTLLALPAGTR